MLVLSPFIWMYDTSITSSSGFDKCIISLCTLLNFVSLTALWTSPDKFGGIANSWTGTCSAIEKSTFSLFTYNLSFVGYLSSPLAITQTDLTLTCELKGIINNSYPSQSEATKFSFQNRLSNSLNTFFPEFACSSFKHLTLSISIAPYKSLAFSAPIYSAQPQLGP